MKQQINSTINNRETYEKYDSYILDFKEIDKTKLAMAGGKGANLGELTRIEGVQVPEGFCVTTEAYKEIIENNEAFNSLLDQLTMLKADNRKVSAKPVQRSES